MRDPLGGRVIVSHPVQRRVQTMHKEDGKIVLNTTFDAEPAIRDAKAHRDHLFPGHYRGTKELGMLKAAVLPLTIWFKLRRDGVLQDPVALQKWLDANPAFKAVPGNVLSHLRPK